MRVEVQGVGFGGGRAVVLRRSRKNPAAPGELMVEVQMTNGLQQWVSPARIREI